MYNGKSILKRRIIFLVKHLKLIYWPSRLVLPQPKAIVRGRVHHFLCRSLHCARVWLHRVCHFFFFCVIYQISSQKPTTKADHIFVVLVAFILISILILIPTPILVVVLIFIFIPISRFWFSSLRGGTVKWEYIKTKKKKLGHCVTVRVSLELRRSVDPSIPFRESGARVFSVRLSSCQSKWHLLPGPRKKDTTAPDVHVDGRRRRRTYTSRTRPDEQGPVLRWARLSEDLHF